MRRRLSQIIALVGCLALPTLSYADVEIETAPVRNYQLPGTFDLMNAQVQLGAGGTTIITNTMGSQPEEAVCGIAIADDSGARLIEYRYAGAPTQCIGALPHPDGGVFIRGSSPTALEGEVTGFTAYIGPDDQEAWSIADQTLVDAAPEPNGTGEFTGAYETAHPAFAYSPELDKLLAFTIGALTIGQEVKFISQAHVVNVESGRLTTSGQTFGLSGVGNVGGATTRSSDGEFLIYYFSSGDQGAFFYAYDGRNNIEFFKPRGEDWDDRFVSRMIYTNDLLHLLWRPSDSEEAQTRVTATTDTGAELWSSSFDPLYRFADGIEYDLGPPLTMWVGEQHTVILHQGGPEMELLLRVLDLNGESLGVARLAEVHEFSPVAIVPSSTGGLKLLTYDDENRQLYELDMTFVDVDDFDPDAGIPDGGFPGDVSFPIGDIGFNDVLKAAGCCATATGGPSSSLTGLLLVFGLWLVRRREPGDE